MKNMQKVNQNCFIILVLIISTFGFNFKTTVQFQENGNNFRSKKLNNDSILLTKMLNYLNISSSKSKYELNEIGNGVYMVKPNNNSCNNKLELEEEAINKLIRSGILNVSNSNKSQSDFEYTYQIVDTKKDFDMLSEEVLANKIFYRNIKGESSILCWRKFESLAEALKAKKLLNNYPQINVKLTML